MQYNKRELLRRAFDNEVVDKVPVGFWHHFVLGKDQFSGLEDESILDRVTEGHIRYYEQTNPDMMKLMNEGFMGYPPIMDNDLQTEEDLLNIKSIGREHPWMEKQVAHVKRLTERFADEVMCFYNVFAPLQFIRIRLEFLDMDFERFVYLAEHFPEAFKQAGLEIQKDLCILVERLLQETKLDGIYYCVQNIQSGQYTKEMYARYIQPTEIEVLQTANRCSDYNILHICGYAHHKNDMRYYKDYSAKVYNWACHTEGISLQEGKALFGNPCVLGGFDNNPGTLIDSGSKEELEAEVASLIRENGYRGYVMGADCSIPNDIDDNRIRIISDAAGRYIREEKDGKKSDE